MLRARKLIGVMAIAAASLVALAGVTPAAQAASQVRQFEAFGLVQTGPGNQGPRVGDMALDFVFKNERAGGKFTPRRLTRVRFSALPLTCQDPVTTAFTTAPLSADLATNVKLKKAPPPGTGKPKPNRYAYRLAWDFGGFALGSFTATVDKANGKGWPRAHGRFTISRYDFPPPGPSNCSTSGQIGWSVPKQCKRPGQSGDLPLCRFD